MALSAATVIDSSVLSSAFAASCGSPEDLVLPPCPAPPAVTPTLPCHFPDVTLNWHDSIPPF